MNSLNLALDNANLSEEQRVRIESQISRRDNVSGILEQNRERIQEQRQERLEDIQARTEELLNRTPQQAGKN